MDDLVNITRRVTWRGGLIGLLAGESQGKALEREIEDLNTSGFRVVFIVSDRWNPFLRLFWLIIGVVTFGLFYADQNLLIIAEGPVEAPQSWGVQSETGELTEEEEPDDPDREPTEEVAPSAQPTLLSSQGVVAPPLAEDELPRN